jgi:hypothetical protein
MSSRQLEDVAVNFDVFIYGLSAVKCRSIACVVTKSNNPQTLVQANGSWYTVLAKMKMTALLSSTVLVCLVIVT